MNSYIEYLVLAYFKQFGQEYSLYDLKDKLGITISKLNKILDVLFQKKLLEYKEGLIVLSKNGRIVLANSEMEEYFFVEDKYMDEEKFVKWPLEKVYVVHGFSKNKWRGSEK